MASCTKAASRDHRVCCSATLAVSAGGQQGDRTGQSVPPHAQTAAPVSAGAAPLCSLPKTMKACGCSGSVPSYLCHTYQAPHTTSSPALLDGPGRALQAGQIGTTRDRRWAKERPTPRQAPRSSVVGQRLLGGWWVKTNTTSSSAVGQAERLTRTHRGRRRRSARGRPARARRP